MRCTFCATGKGGFARNLAAHEIVDQVMTAQEKFGRRVSNVGELLQPFAWDCASSFVNLCALPACRLDRHVRDLFNLSPCQLKK